MKKILFLFLTLIIFSQLTYAQNTPQSDTWETRIENAQKKAGSTNRPILMVFSGSDWCKPCIKMTNEIWKSEAFLSFAGESLVLLSLDFPAGKKRQLPEEQKAHNDALAEKYNTQGTFPLAVLIEKGGNTLTRFGYDPSKTPVDYINYLKKNIPREQR